MNIDTTMYFITDSTGFTEEEFLYRVEEACKGGVTLLQLREKEKTTREYIALAEKVHEITRKYNIPLIIDDRADVALAVDAEGVHVGQSDMRKAAKIIGDTFGCDVLLKGGHSVSDANDILYSKGAYLCFNGRRISNQNTHGTGCTLSSAIASNLAKGYGMAPSVERAKEYISGALEAMLDLGKGSGPVNHAFDINSYFTE